VLKDLAFLHVISYAISWPHKTTTGVAGMNRLLGIGIFIGLSLASVASATVCPTTTWTFGAFDCGSTGTGNAGVQFTQGGQTITIFPEEFLNGVQSNASTTLPVNGLFEVHKGQSNNLASGLGPYNTNQGGDPFNGQGGIQDNDLSPNVDDLLIIEVSQNNIGAGGIASGTTLSFLMQQGDQANTFNVYTSTSSSSTPPTALSTMNEVHMNLPVGNLDGGASSQFSVTTNTSSLNPYEYIAIQNDCTYLLLNSITETGGGAVPEPRFYGLLLAGMLALAGIFVRKPRVTE
jgi:hypothetical protein